jgi:dihydropyrimidine dehydrogenase (NAD+) subunit PreA
MAEKGFATIEDFRGLSLPNVREWKQLNLNYQIVARIHEDLCIGCQLCYTACWDGAHQCIHLDRVSPVPDTTRTPGMVEAESARRISTTPIPKLDAGMPGGTNAVTPLERIPRVDKDHCVAAICAPWFVLLRTASRWSASIKIFHSKAGKSALPRVWFRRARAR